LQKKGVSERNEGFSLRVKIGEYEVELSGTHAEVMNTVESLPELITNISKAFENVKPRTVATLTVKTAEDTKTSKTPEVSVQNYPKIAATEEPEKAVLRLLESDWGKWRPRTTEELKEAIKANDLKYPSRTLTSSLEALAEKGLVRRWNTNAGSVYILADEKPTASGGE